MERLFILSHRRPPPIPSNHAAREKASSMLRDGEEIGEVLVRALPDSGQVLIAAVARTPHNASGNGGSAHPTDCTSWNVLCVGSYDYGVWNDRDDDVRSSFSGVREQSDF